MIPMTDAPIFIYVSGPYTSNPDENTAEAIRIGNELWELGFVPFIPHLTHFWHKQIPRPYDDWLAMDLKWLTKCDAVFRLPGESSGADMECVFARKLGLLVFHDVDSLTRFDWVQHKRIEAMRHV